MFFGSPIGISWVPWSPRVQLHRAASIYTQTGVSSAAAFFISGIEVLEVATPRATQPVTFVLAIYSGWKAFSPVLSVQHAIRLESVQFGVCR